MKKKTIVARAEILKGREEDFMAAAEPLIRETRAEKGNISYNLYRNPAQPGSFLFYEEYADQEAIAKHAASDHFQAFGKAIEDCLASELIIETF